jgi:hypothetical protein
MARTRHFVAYDSERVMGRDYRTPGRAYGPSERFSFYSGKSRSVLNAALGQHVWVISSTEGKLQRYFLEGCYTPERVTADGAGWNISGQGVMFASAVEIANLAWFRELFREQNNFSYGFNEIRSPTIIEELLRSLGSFEESLEQGSEANDYERGIRQMLDIGPTERLDLISARRGQGVFRDNLCKIELACRLTGLQDVDHLRASHVKPWHVCDDREKLDGYNGLLLSPHIDHLFDQGYISFSDNGDMLVSEDLQSEVLRRWSIALPQNVGRFHERQCRYLDYHRRNVFRSSGVPA